MPKTITPKQLIAALGSGKFRKARGQLEKKGGFCCLGVACEIAGAAYDPACGGLHSFAVEGASKWSIELSRYERDGAPEWAPWLTTDLQGSLATANDTTSGFTKAIEILRGVKP